MRKYFCAWLYTKLPVSDIPVMKELIWDLLTRICSASVGCVIPSCLQYVLMRTRMSQHLSISRPFEKKLLFFAFAAFLPLPLILLWVDLGERERGKGEMRGREVRHREKRYGEVILAYSRHLAHGEDVCE